MTHARLLSLGLVVLTASCSGRGCGGSGTELGAKAEAPVGNTESKRAAPPSLRHLFLIMMENQGTDAILGNPADAPRIHQLAQRGGVALQYFGVTHPSMPNYLALFSGDFQGIWDDCAAGPSVTCKPEEFVPDADDGTVDLLLTPAQVARSSSTKHWFTGRNLVDQLEAKHLTWKAYMQGLPAVGSTVDFAPIETVNGHEVSRDLYAQRHDPFMYFTDVRDNPERMQRIVPATQLSVDLRRAETTPSFVWLSPDNCHNMHGLSADNAAAVGLPDCALPDEDVEHKPDAAGSAGAQDRDRDRGARVGGQADPKVEHKLEHKVIQLGDAYVGSVVDEIMASPAWRDDAAIVIVWDEDDFSGHDGCCGGPSTDGKALGGARAPLLVLTSRSSRAKVVNRPANHYGLLGTIQQLWGLGCLAHTCELKDDELLADLFHD